jgi:DNA-binding LytR/AlgR family response regulator
MTDISVLKRLVRLLGGAFETKDYRMVLTDTAVLMRPKEGGEDVKIPYGDIERIGVQDRGLRIKTKENVRFFELGVDKTSKKV